MTTRNKYSLEVRERAVRMVVANEAGPFISLPLNGMTGGMPHVLEFAWTVLLAFRLTVIRAT